MRREAWTETMGSRRREVWTGDEFGTSWEEAWQEERQDPWREEAVSRSVDRTVKKAAYKETTVGGRSALTFNCAVSCTPLRGVGAELIPRRPPAWLVVHPPRGEHEGCAEDEGERGREVEEREGGEEGDEDR